MNSIERVKAAIHFKGPDRVPVWKAGLADVFPMPMLPPKNWQPGHFEYDHGLFPFTGMDEWIRFHLWKWDRPDWARSPRYKNFLALQREEIDEWGVIWSRTSDNSSMGHPAKAPLPEWAGYDAYLKRYSPDALDKTRYSLFASLSRLVARKRYRMGILGFQGPFTMASAIRGFIPFMADHRKNPERLKELLNHLTEFYVEAIRMWVRYGADPHGFVLYDDMGDQQRPFISPRKFDEFYQRVFGRLIEVAHEFGCEFHLHSCGKIDPLIPALVDWGLDALELDSPHMIGYGDLRPFRGKIMLWGCINIQSTYVNGTPGECEQEVKAMIKNMGTPEGGFGAYFYPQTNHIKVPDHNIRAFRQGLKRYGDYRKNAYIWEDK